jgi:hypothetical protein
LQKFLNKASDKLIGEVSPETHFFQLRKQGKNQVMDAQQSRSSNPQRASAKARQRRRGNAKRRKVQRLYRTQRGKAVQEVFDDGEPNKDKSCSIPIEKLEQHFKKIFETPNNNVLENYPAPSQVRENITVTSDEVNRALHAISLDTSPGPDKVLVHTLRKLNSSDIIMKIIEIMLATGTVPYGLSEGRLSLAPKDGDLNQIGNWRPLTIYSVIRRIIEKVLDKNLRAQVDINSNQRGFTDKPGCHMNTALIEKVLRKAKQEKSNAVIVFLDLSKAFDQIGHEHLKKCLESLGVSSNLQRLVMSLLTSNTVRVQTKKHRSNPIKIMKSVPQGGPLSPLLYNIATSFVYQEVCESGFANAHGFKLDSEHDALSMAGFADDNAIFSSSVKGASRLIETARSLFEMIGLRVNPLKSAAIHIKKGQLVPGKITLSDGTSIQCIDEHTTIKHLGCNFNSELVFDDVGILQEMTRKLNKLKNSALLNKDQKLNVISQYILPMMSYPLQTAPLTKIPKTFLNALDTTIRGTAIGIIGLPAKTTTHMFYAPRKYRGIGLVRAEWEVFLQHFSISKRLSTVDDALFQKVYDCRAEMEKCKSELNVEGETSRQMRTNLRKKAFDDWTKMPGHGKGVQHFATFPKANHFMVNKNSLTDSEWTEAIKLNIGYANLKCVYGSRCYNSQTNLCRRCAKEPETLPHVLGSCDWNSKRRTARHHALKHSIAEMMTQKGFDCFDEVFCLDGDHSRRFADIVAFEKNTNKAYVIDPTVRYETNEDVGALADAEKKKIYDSCVPDIKLRYHQFGDREFEVIGLWFGARGAVSKEIIQFFERFKLDKKCLPELAENVLADSIQIVRSHIYSLE